MNNVPEINAAGKRVSELIPVLLEFERDLKSVAVHAATELNFRVLGADAGSCASLRLAELISGKHSRARTPEERVRVVGFDPTLAKTAYDVFRSSGYRAYGDNVTTVQLLGDMDSFARELESIEKLSIDRLELLRRTCLTLPYFTYSSN